MNYLKKIDLKKEKKLNEDYQNKKLKDYLAKPNNLLLNYKRNL